MGSQEQGLVAEYQRILTHNGIRTEINDVQVETPALAGEHLGSDCFCVTLSMQDGTKRHLFVKRVSANPPDFFKDIGLFNKESSFVNYLLKDLQAKHTAAGLKQPLDFFPRYLWADEERIVMENLGMCGYTPVSKLVKLDLEYVKHVLDKLALFHSLSYGIDIDSGASGPDAYLKRYPFLRERFYVEGKEVFNIAYDNLIRTRISVLKASGLPGAEKAVKFLEAAMGTVYSHVLGAVSHKSPHAFYVVNHGDCWITNLLFKKDPVTGALDHHIFLDFQLMRVGSPCLDLCYFLFTSTQPSILHNTWKHLLHFYYERLQANMELQGKQFTHSFAQLLTDFKSKFRFGFWLNMTFFTGFDIFPHIDMGKVERDVEDTGLGVQIEKWIQGNRSRAQELAGEIVVLVDTFNEICGE